jgi:hypothetical protein
MLLLLDVLWQGDVQKWIRQTLDLEQLSCCVWAADVDALPLSAACIATVLIWRRCDAAAIQELLAKH